MIRYLPGHKFGVKNLNWDVFETRQKKILKKKNWKKNWNFFWIFFFLFFLLLLIVLKVSGFRTVRILKICWTSRPDVMSGRVLISKYYFSGYLSHQALLVLFPPFFLLLSSLILLFKGRMVFCYQNCSDLLWEKLF